MVLWISLQLELIIPLLARMYLCINGLLFANHYISSAIYVALSQNVIIKWFSLIMLEWGLKNVRLARMTMLIKIKLLVYGHVTLPIYYVIYP